MNYKGVIIEESLKNKSILKDVKILETKVEEVTEEHKTPWIKQWTLHNVEIPENQGGKWGQSRLIKRSTGASIIVCPALLASMLATRYTTLLTAPTVD